MQIELKPCPFCNGSASYAYFVRSRNSTQQFVVCDDCGAESKLCDSREEAAAAWNKRPYDAKVNGLRPCPFCGGKAKYESSLYVKPLQDENGAYVDYDEMYYWERTYCTECGAEISSESDDDEEEITITKWNRR